MTRNLIQTLARPVAGLRDLASSYDLILCDVWGVVHDGVTHTPSAAEALMRYRAGGGKVILLTNAPRPHPPVIEMLDDFGLPRAAYDAVVSSGDVTLDLMVARGPRPVFHLGPARDHSLFDDAAPRLGAPVARVDVASADYVVCTGLFNDDERPESYEPVLRAMRARNLPMICANPDIVVHSGDRLIWCAGALADMYVKIGGDVAQAGKPYAIIYEAALKVATRLSGGRSPRAVLAIGDGMFTDMRGAAQQNFDGLFISGGIHRDALHGPKGLDAEAYRALATEAGAQPVAQLVALTW